MGAWAVFSFRIGFLSDEKEERFDRVWVDLSRNIICEEMRRLQHLIGFTDKPVLFDPLTSPCDLASAFKLACGWMKEQAERERESRIRQTELEREKRRIADYYDELKQETLKRAERKGLTEEKKAELLDKAESIGMWILADYSLFLDEEDRVVEAERYGCKLGD